MMTSPRNARDDDPRTGRSETGRASVLATTSRATISKQQVDVIRNRITSGAYDTPQVIDSLARRIHRSGDL